MKSFCAIVLDPTHRLLMTEESSVILGEASDSLAGFTQTMQAIGMELPPPVGVAPPNFAFLISESKPAPAGYRWVSFREAQSTIMDTRYWELYTSLLLGSYVPPSRDIDIFSFGNSPFMAARLAHLVTKGKKRATSANLLVLKKFGLTIPTPGLVSIVTDSFGIPLCCIQTEKVETRKFSEVPPSVAIAEGEGDLSLEDWRRGHWSFFSKEAESLGIPFDEDSEVLTEWFHLIKVF